MLNECIAAVPSVKSKSFLKNCSILSPPIELDIIESLTEPEPGVRRTVRLVTCPVDGVNTRKLEHPVRRIRSHSHVFNGF